MKGVVLRWLLDSDPSIRWQVMRDLTDAPDAEVTVERTRVATEGWAPQLLKRQNRDGSWGDGVKVPRWQRTLFTMVLLKNMGLDPKSGAAQKAVARLRKGFTWGADFPRDRPLPPWADNGFFEGEVEPCINGHALAVGAYFGHPNRRLADRLLRDQLADGGWNCDAERGSTVSSFHSTICVLEGLLEYERAKGGSRTIAKARTRAHEYLLKRSMFRRLSTGEVVDHSWTRFAFPTLWRYDVLRGLDYLRSAGVRDERAREAVDLVVKRRHQNGRWPLGLVHPEILGLVMEPGRGQRSRWITLRALRVLRWFRRGD